MAVAGAAVAAVHAAVARGGRSGVPLLELEQIAAGCSKNVGAPRRSSATTALSRHPVPVSQRRHRPWDPHVAPSQGGRHPLDRRRRHLRGLPRRRCLTMPSATSSPQANRAHRGHRAGAVGRDRRGPDGGHSATSERRWMRSAQMPATASSRSTSDMASAGRCTRSPRSPTTGRRGQGLNSGPACRLCIEPMFNLGTPRPACMPMAGQWAQPMAPFRPISSTRSA